MFSKHYTADYTALDLPYSSAEVSFVMIWVRERDHILCHSPLTGMAEIQTLYYILSHWLDDCSRYVLITISDNSWMVLTVDYMCTEKSQSLPKQWLPAPMWLLGYPPYILTFKIKASCWNLIYFLFKALLTRSIVTIPFITIRVATFLSRGRKNGALCTKPFDHCEFCSTILCLVWPNTY